MYTHNTYAPSWATMTRPVIHHSSTEYPPGAMPILSHAPYAMRAQGSEPTPFPLHTPSDNHLHRSPSEAGLGAFRILIPISVAGWVLFGASAILCINGKGRAGRWVPEWYLDSAGTRRDRAMVAAWWLAVLLLWPVIVPVVLVGALVRRVRKAVGKMQRKRRDRLQSDEEEQAMEVEEEDTETAK